MDSMTPALLFHGPGGQEPSEALVAEISRRTGQTLDEAFDWVYSSPESRMHPDVLAAVQLFPDPEPGYARPVIVQVPASATLWELHRFDTYETLQEITQRVSSRSGRLPRDGAAHGDDTNAADAATPGDPAGCSGRGPVACRVAVPPEELTSEAPEVTWLRRLLGLPLRVIRPFAAGMHPTVRQYLSWLCPATATATPPPPQHRIVVNIALAGQEGMEFSFSADRTPHTLRDIAAILRLLAATLDAKCRPVEENL